MSPKKQLLEGGLENQAPPKKARTATSGEADAVDAGNDAGNDPNETMPAWAVAMRAELDALKQDHDALKQDHDGLNARIDNLTEAFEPVITYALLETAVCEFVKKAIPSGWEREESKINHGMSSLCARVLTNFLSGMGDQKTLSWQGPSTKPRVGFPRNSVPSLVQHGLAGLAVYIELQADAAALQNMDSGNRNMLAHNGACLDAFFKTPTRNARPDSPGFQGTKAQVKESRLRFASEASSSSVPSTIEDAVALVVSALAAKSFVVDTGVQTANINALKALP